MSRVNGTFIVLLICGGLVHYLFKFLFLNILHLKNDGLMCCDCCDTVMDVFVRIWHLWHYRNIIHDKADDWELSLLYSFFVITRKNMIMEKDLLGIMLNLISVIKGWVKIRLLALISIICCAAVLVQILFCQINLWSLLSETNTF